MGSIGSSETTHTAGTAAGHEGLIEALAQRQQVFSQLGSFVTAMQNETGSAEVWRSKLKELEALRHEKRSLKHDLASANQQLQRSQQLEVKAAEKCKRLDSERRRSNEAAAMEQTAREKAETAASDLRARVAALEAEAKTLATEAKNATLMAETSQELNQELGRVRRELDATASNAAQVSRRRCCRCCACLL